MIIDNYMLKQRLQKRYRHRAEMGFLSGKQICRAAAKGKCAAPKEALRNGAGAAAGTKPLELCADLPYLSDGAESKKSF